MIINCRLRPGKDDNLESWYKSLPKGERSRIIRRALKQYAGKELTEVDSIENMLNENPEKLNKGNTISELVEGIFD